MTEEQFNGIAYNYRSWPGHDPKGVSERYEELWSLFQQQAERINNMQQWEKRYLDVIEAQKKLIEAQDEHIVDLAFKLVYAERGNEVAKELSK